MDHSMEEPVEEVSKPTKDPDFPLRAYMWKKGQSGNPAGGSQKSRLQRTFAKYLDEYGLDEEVFKTFMAEMVGRKDQQIYIDPGGNRRVRKPKLEYFKVFMQVLYGEARPAPQSDEAADTRMDREDALFVVKKMAAIRHELDQRRLGSGMQQLPSYGEASTSYSGDGLDAEAQ